MLFWRSLFSLSPNELPSDDWGSLSYYSSIDSSSSSSPSLCDTTNPQSAKRFGTSSSPLFPPFTRTVVAVSGDSGNTARGCRSQLRQRANLVNLGVLQSHCGRRGADRRKEGSISGSVTSKHLSDDEGAEYFSVDDAVCSESDESEGSAGRRIPRASESLPSGLGTLPPCLRARSSASSSSSSSSCLSSYSTITRRVSRSASSSASVKTTAALHMYAENSVGKLDAVERGQDGNHCCDDSATSTLENSCYRSNPKQPRLAAAAAANSRRLQHLLLQKTLRHLYAKGTLPRGVKLARVSSLPPSPRAKATKVPVGGGSDDGEDGDESDLEGTVATEWSSSIATPSRRLSRASAATAEGTIFERARSFSFKLQQDCLGMLRDSWISASARSFSFYRSSNGSRSGSSTRSSTLTTRHTDDDDDDTAAADDFAAELASADEAKSAMTTTTAAAAATAACLVPFLSGEEELEETSPNALAERVSLEIRQRRLQRDRPTPQSYLPAIYTPPQPPCIFNSGSYIALPHQLQADDPFGARNEGSCAASPVAANDAGDNDDDCNSWMTRTTWHLSLPSRDSPLDGSGSTSSRRRPLLDRRPSCRSNRPSQQQNFAARFFHATFARSECEPISSSFASSPSSVYIRYMDYSDGDSSGGSSNSSRNIISSSHNITSKRQLRLYCSEELVGPMGCRRLSIQDVTDRVLFDNYVLAQRERTLSWLEVPLCTFVD